MAALINTSLPIKVFVNHQHDAVKSTFNHLDQSPKVDLSQVSPSVREEATWDLVTGNSIQIQRLDFYRKLLPDRCYTSGISERRDCEVSKIDLEPAVNASLTKGAYNLGRFNYFLYGGLGFSEPVEMVQTLSYRPDPRAPLSVRIWTRNSNGEYCSALDFKEVTEETAELEPIALDGRSGLPSESLAEYMYDPDTNEITINRNNYFVKTPDVPGSATSRELYAYGDFLGIATGIDCEHFHTKYFPFVNTGIYTYPEITDDNLDVNGWIEVSDFMDSLPTDRHVVVDHMTGSIRFGGKLGGDSELLSELAGAETTSMLVRNGEVFADRGSVVVTSGFLSERIKYHYRLGNRLCGLERPSAFTFPPGSQVVTAETGRRLDAGYLVSICYNALAMASYEIDSTMEEVSVASRPKKNQLNPYQLKNTESILCITHQSEEIAKVELTPVDLSKVRLSSLREAWGPVYGRSDIVLLEGFVSNSQGIGLGGILVTVTVTGPGSIEYLDSITVATNDEGKFWVNYIPDEGAATQPFYAIESSISYEGGDTLITFDSDAEIATDDLNLVSLYAITKDDPTIGTVGHMVEVPVVNMIGDPMLGPYVGTRFSSVLPAALPSFKTEDALLLWDVNQLGDLGRFAGGKVLLEYTDLAYDGIPGPTNFAEFEIQKIIHVFGDEVLERSMGLVCFKEALTMNPNTIFQIWLKTYGDFDWVAADLNGRKAVLRVLHGSSPDDEHTVIGSFKQPHTDSYGAPQAHKPVTPKAYEGGNTFRFEGILPIPDANDPSQYLGGYCIFSEAESSIIAYAQDPECPGLGISSAPVYIYNAISPMDSGTIELGIEDTYVPFGFRLIDSLCDAASTLDTATYLTVNDYGYALGLPVISFINSSGTLSYTEDIPRLLGNSLMIEIRATA